MRLRAALSGNLEKIMADELADGEAAAMATMDKASKGLKEDLRRDVRSAGLGDRLAKTWRSAVFPKSGRSLGAAGTVWTKAPRLLRAFDDGTVIRSSRGFYLAIPTPAAPKKGIGGKRINPSNFPEHRFGKLRFIYRRGRASLLVVEGLTARRGKTGGFRKATVRKATKTRGATVSLKGLTTVVMFILVPQVKLRKRLNVAPIAARWQAQVPRLLAQEWEARAARRGRGGR